MATYNSHPLPNPQLIGRRNRPTTLPNTRQRPHHYKVAPYKVAQTQHYTAPHLNPAPLREELTRIGKYVIRNGNTIAEDMHLAFHVLEQKTYVTKWVHKKHCQRVISKYKEICYSTELPHIKEIITEEDHVLIVLNLHPYFDILPQTVEQERAQKLAKEVLELVHKVHECGISPHRMSIDDFTLYKETPASIGYHLQMMKLNHSLMLDNSDEELADIDANTAPELVHILTSQNNSVGTNPELPISKSKLEAIREHELDLEKADSWRVGAMIYTMIAGRSPFPDPITETNQFFDAIKNRQLKPPTKKTSRNAWEFLLGLLEPDPEERLSISQALEHPWLQEYALRLESHGMFSSREEHKLPSSTPSSPTY